MTDASATGTELMTPDMVRLNKHFSDMLKHGKGLTGVEQNVLQDIYQSTPEDRRKLIQHLEKINLSYMYSCLSLLGGAAGGGLVLYENIPGSAPLGLAFMLATVATTVSMMVRALKGGTAVQREVKDIQQAHQIAAEKRRALPYYPNM